MNSLTFSAPETAPEPLADAAYATLNHKAISDQAKGLVGQLASLVEDEERTRGKRVRKRRAASLEKLEGAIEGFLGDLLDSAYSDSGEGWTYRSLKRESFSKERVGYRQFVGVLESLKGLGLVEHREGHQRLTSFPDGSKWPYILLSSIASRFRATSELIAIAEANGVNRENIDNHLEPRLPQKPLVLKAASTRLGSEKVDGDRLNFKHNGHSLALEAQIKALNEFLSGFKIRGGRFTGYVRIFNEGDTEGFAWNKGGRLYGDRNYQLLPKDARLAMTIAGEPVAEVDISASYLTLLHGLQGLPLDTDKDLYEVEGLSRDVVKAWVTATLGHKKHFSEWPDKVVERHLKRTGQDLLSIAPILSVRRAMESKYPILRDWSLQTLTWADLMFAESEIIIGAMNDLMDQGVPALSVHDSLLVRRKDSERAREALGRRYHGRCGLYPKLSTVESKSLQEA